MSVKEFSVEVCTSFRRNIRIVLYILVHAVNDANIFFFALENC